MENIINIIESPDKVRNNIERKLDHAAERFQQFCHSWGFPTFEMKNPTLAPTELLANKEKIVIANEQMYIAMMSELNKQNENFLALLQSIKLLRDDQDKPDYEWLEKMKQEKLIALLTQFDLDKQIEMISLAFYQESLNEGLNVASKELKAITSVNLQCIREINNLSQQINLKIDELCQHILTHDFPDFSPEDKEAFIRRLLNTRLNNPSSSSLSAHEAYSFIKESDYPPALKSRLEELSQLHIACATVKTQNALLDCKTDLMMMDIKSINNKVRLAKKIGQTVGYDQPIKMSKVHNTHSLINERLRGQATAPKVRIETKPAEIAASGKTVNASNRPNPTSLFFRPAPRAEEPLRENVRERNKSLPPNSTRQS